MSIRSSILSLSFHIDRFTSPSAHCPEEDDEDDDDDDDDECVYDDDECDEDPHNFGRCFLL